MGRPRSGREARARSLDFILSGVESYGRVLKGMLWLMLGMRTGEEFRSLGGRARELRVRS